MRLAARFPLISLTFVIAALAQSPESEKEIALGRAVIKEFAGAASSDQVVNEFVDKLAVELTQSTGTLNEIRLLLVETPDVTTRPLPGGFLLVGTGVIAQANTAAEVAAILAHGIAHITQGHGRRGNVFMEACARASGAHLPVSLKANGELQEQQADLLALEYLDRSGYDPTSLITAFDHVRSSANFAVTSAIRERAGGYSTNERAYVTNTSAFNEVRARLERRVAQR